MIGEVKLAVMGPNYPLIYMYLRYEEKGIM